MVRARGTNNGIRYLPDDVPMADLGLLDGTTLTLAVRPLRPAPTLYVDLEQAEDDLYLIDERGTHRGRVTRLPADRTVYVGKNLPEDEDGIQVIPVLVDDAYVDDLALRLTNLGADHVFCEVRQAEGWVVAGETVTHGTARVLPGSTISYIRDHTVYVSFVVTTRAALHGRSPVGRVQFDVAARRSRPKYDLLPDRVARVAAQPRLADAPPFPKEQVGIPLAMVGALAIGTHNALTLLTAPIAAALPIFTYRRQRTQEKRKYERERGEWLDKLDEISKTLTDLAGQEEKNLRLESPAPEEWALRAYRRLAGLWERDPGQDDFLHVRLGLGRLLSRYETQVDDGTDIEDLEFKLIMSIAGREVGKDVVRPKVFDVPVTRDLRQHHLGLVGPAALIDDVATDLLVQISCGHPPGAVGIAALLPASSEARQRYEWLKWLPHTRSGSTLLPSARIVAGRDACDDFLVQMQRLHTERREHRAEEAPSSYALVVVHEAAEVDIALLTEVCDLADGLVRVIWLGSSKDTAPKFTRSLVELAKLEPEPHPEEPGKRKNGKLGSLPSRPAEFTGMFCGEDDEPLRFELNMFRAEPSATVHALAGLYDPRSSGTSAGVPQSAPLSAVAELAATGYRDLPDISLADAFPLPMGLGEGGVLDLDLIGQGPHVLIGGTTGSGKSELLQTLTCGAISRYGPAEVSLFLVDFKGGATFAPFRELPHIVGYVTDMDQRNVNRALDFLRAELRRREKEFEDLGNAKEYREYLERALERAAKGNRIDILPRLVVMFDEFATIVQDFERDTINAVIDIARRGRSWGVHLILATQQPTRDVVVPQVRGNVNARIALRTPSPDESLTIIDRPEAAHIPQNFPGRALMTLGGNRLVEFQTAFGGAPYIAAGTQALVAVTPFRVAPEARPRSPAPPSDQPKQKRGTETQLQALVNGVARLDKPRSPGAAVMLPALEDQDPWPTPAENWKHVPAALTSLWLGRRDLPKEQKQDELRVDLARGGLCLVGPNRSGVTTTLVTVADAFAQQLTTNTQATVIAFDAANRLRTELGQRFENVITLSMTRLDEITRCIDQLWTRIRQRMAQDLPAGDQSATDDIGRPGAPPSEAILLLIDGFEVLMGTLAAPGGTGLWATRLMDVLTLGRRAGVYSVISVRSLQGLDRSIIGSQASIITLHGHYEGMAIPQDHRLPGFGLDRDGNLVQFFIPSAFPPADRRHVFDAGLATSFAPDGWRRVPMALPQIRAGDLEVGLGVDEVTHDTFLVSLADTHLLVTGTVRSGRTKLLLTLADQITAQVGAPVAFFSPRGLPREGWRESVMLVTPEQLTELSGVQPAERAGWLAQLGVAQLKDGRTVLLVDDAHAIDPLENASTIHGLLRDLFRLAVIQPVAVCTVVAATNTPIPQLIEPMKKSGVSLYLSPSADRADVDNGYRLRGLKLQHRPGVVYRRGDLIIQTEDAQHVTHLPELVDTGIMP